MEVVPSDFATSVMIMPSGSVERAVTVPLGSRVEEMAVPSAA